MPLYCPVCNARYQDDATFCPKDGASLLSPGHDNPASMIGATIADRYEVIAQIATGGMGVVYKARQKMLDRYVALKVLPRDLGGDPDTERRFFNEARAISQLRHPHIVTLFDFGRTPDRKLFIAMEYVNGESLAETISHRPLPLTSAVRIADQVLDALGEAHQQGIVHRDIKPDNVMLEVRGGRIHVRLLDFGIAKNELDTARHTKTGIVFGTPEYISPEQVLGDDLDHRADLYAVGLLLFEMLSGERPFGGSGTAIAYKHAHDPTPSLLERYPDLPIPAALDALVYRLMAKKPAQRPDSAGEVRHLLQAATLLPPEPGYQSGPLPPLPLDLPDLGLPPPFDVDRPLHASPTVRSGPPPPAPPPFAAPFDDLGFDLDDPFIGVEAVADPPSDPAPSAPPPAARPADRHSLDDLLGPRPPRPRSTEAAPTRQAPASLFERPPASRRPLVLGALLAVVGISSLVASAWIERPLDPDPIPPRPVPPAAVTTPPVPETPPTWNDELINGLTTPPEPRSVPTALKATHDLAIMPSPRPEADALDPGERRAAISEARAALAALPPDDPARAVHLRTIGDLEWAAANVDYANEYAHFERASTAYVQGQRKTAPPAPVPAYGDALIAYQQLLELAPRAPDRLEITARLAHALIAAGRIAEGLDRWRTLLAEDPHAPHAARARLALADAAHGRGDDTTAAAHYRALALSDDPRLSRYARYMLGHLELALRDPESAVDDFQALLDGLRDDPVAAAHYRTRAIDALTLAYLDLPAGRRQAQSYFRGLGGDALARRQARLLALGYAARGDAAEAAAAWRRVLEDTTTPVDAPGDRARVLIQLAEQEAAAGRPDAALALLDGPLAACAPLADDPLALSCLTTLGNARRAAGRPDADEIFARVAAHPIDDAAADPIAEARFRLAEPPLRALLAAPEPPPDATLEAIDAAYRRVIDVGVPRWSVAAHYRRGQARAHLATLYAADPARAEDTATAERLARERYTEAARLADAHDITTRWADAARAAIGADAIQE